MQPFSLSGCYLISIKIKYYRPDTAGACIQSHQIFSRLELIHCSILSFNVFLYKFVYKSVLCCHKLNLVKIVN